MFAKFRNLSENAQRLLCIYAYSGMGSQTSLSSFKKKLNDYFPDFKPNSDDAQTELNKNGMFERKGFSWYTNQYNYVLTEHTFVPALWYCLEERKDLVEVFESKMRLSGGGTFTNLRNSLKQLVSTNYTTCANAMYLSYSDAKYFATVSMVKQFKPLFDCMTRDVFEVFFTSMFSEFIENDIVVSASYLEELVDGNRGLTALSAMKLKSYVELYSYMAFGTRPKHDVKTNDFAGLTLAAIYRVLEGKYAEAIKIFMLAMKIHNKKSDMKNMYLVSLLNYYLIVAYAHDGSVESKTKMKQFLNKGSISEIRALVPSRIIAEQTLSVGKEWHAEGVRSLLLRAEAKTSPITYGYLAFLLDKYYEMHVMEELTFINIGKPRLAILQHELSEYIDLSEDECAHLKAMYGDKAGLTAVKHKAEWELSLERLMKFGLPEEKQVEEKDARIMYIMNGFRGGIDVREQTRLKNGQWGSGKSVGYARFLTNDVECMEDSDRRIIDRFRSSGAYDLRLEHIVEEMTIESRLYSGMYAPFTLVKVIEEKPYVIVERTRKGFQIRSNVRLGYVDDKIIITEQKEDQVTFIKLPDEQRPVYRELLHIGTFPLSAEEALSKALNFIGAKVEIHSELIPGGSTLPTVQGSGLACVQLNPTSDGFYTLTISSHPIPDGRNYFSLGKGDVKFIDEHEGQRVWVERDLETETKAAHLFVEFFNEQRENGDTDFHDTEVMLDAESKLELDPVEMLTILEFIQEHPDMMYAEWPQGKKAKIRPLTKGLAQWSGTLHEKGMWFQLEGDIQIDENTVLSMSQLLDLVASSKGKYVRLSDGEFLALSEKLQRQLRALDAVANREKGQIQISPFSAALLGDDALNGDIQIFMSNNLVELRKRILDNANYKPEVPAELTAVLRPYQVDGFQWMARLNSWGAGALLADDMGLGKTIQTIAFLLLKAKEGASLVVAPASVAPNWKSEFEKFAPTLNTIILNFADDRDATIKNAGPNDVIITTYGILLSAQESINSRSWNIACLDEAHIIKNRGAKTSAAALKIKADNRVILTGTPVQNHLSELWSLFQFINPGLLGGYEVFSRKFITPIERDQDKECQKRLDKVVHPFMLRRTKNAVLQELPEKTEIYQKIELSQEENAVYEVIRKKAEQLLVSQEKDMKVDFNVLAEITRLRQASCSPRLVEHNWQGTSSKVTALIELLQGIIEGDNRALVFSQFTSFFDIVREELDKQGIKYLYIDGSVPVKRRTELVAEFQNTDTSQNEGAAKIFLISLKAGGLGLNLTNANYVIHLDPWWNPAIEQQATDRAYRIGQHQAVTVYHLISEGTIEEKIIRLHQTKRDLAENILEGTDVSHKLTGKDLLEMVSK